MSTARLNVGVIGVGYWGRKIVDECSRIGAVALDGISDRDPGNLGFCAEKYGIENLYEDYRLLLARDTLQAVSICTPNSLHYRIAREALLAGKHVLVEKPMALNSAESRELMEIAVRKSLVVSVGHVFRFNNVLAEVKRLICEKHFGRVFLIEMNWVNLERSFPDRDVIWDQGPHIFDIQNYLLDQWPVALNCVGGAFRRTSGEETAFISSTFNDGTMGMAAISWLVPRKARRIFVTGEVRSADVDVLAQKLTVYERGVTTEIPIKPNNTIKDEILHFVECIVDRSKQPGNSAWIGVKTVELIEAAKRSMAEGRAIRLDAAMVRRAGA